MALLRQDLFNSPYVGVFCAVSDALALLPPGIPANDRAAISEALGAPVIEATVGGSRVLGTLVAMNSQGLLVSNLATGRERDALAIVAEKHGLRFGVLEERANAAGNNRRKRPSCLSRQPCSRPLGPSTSWLVIYCRESKW
jgi:translation initiation factor 6